MSLPNYSPSGKILFGSVPWDNGYKNVRLYTSTSAQYSDIAGMMTLSSSNYTYIGRNRRIKVAIEADRLYHCNYCMYRNDSLTDGYIYCFVTDVQYINDHTTEITVETDVFNTYLYGTDWQIPACFIERETTPSDSGRYMYTDEPSFSMPYIADGSSRYNFTSSGFVLMTSMTPNTDASKIVPVTNPEGWYGKPVNMNVIGGIPQGTAMWYFPKNTSAGSSEDMEAFISHLTYAGSAGAISALIAIPSFANPGSQGKIGSSGQQLELTYQKDVGIPENKTSLNGYTPRNNKLHYYPYSFVEYGDGQGQNVQLRYEFMEENCTLRIKYSITPACQAFVFPYNYRGKPLNYDEGIVVNCGALGSWNNNTFANWVGQNSGKIALSAAQNVIAGAIGASTISGAAATLEGLSGEVGAAMSETQLAKATARAESAYGRGVGMVGQTASNMANAAEQFINGQSRMPTLTRGQVNGNTLFSTSSQGVYAYRIVVKAEVAQLIDQFFDRWGYAVNAIEAVNITSRPSWNYVKTIGAAPKSLNGGAGSTAPFTRGRGTPAAALSIIRQAFDNGVTFWHTTSGFGNFQLGNSL